MTRAHPSHRLGLRVAPLIALHLVGGIAAAQAEEIFWIDGLAVDAMASPADSPDLFTGGMPSLVEGGPRTPRGRLLDEPEPPRDPVIQRQISNLAEEADRRAQAGELEAALLPLRDALALDPRNPALLSRAAIHAASLRDFERAAGFFRRFLEIEPDDAGHLGGYAAVLLRLVRLDEAERHLRLAETLMPDGLVVRFTRLVLDLLHEREPADPAYWMRRPVDQLALIARWLEADRETLARLVGTADYERLCAITLGEDTHDRLDEIEQTFRRVQEAQREGNLERGLETIEHLAAMGVSSRGLDAARAEMLFDAGRETEALALWEALAEQDGAWRETWFNLGFTRFRMGDYAQAAEALRRARWEREPPVVRFVLASALSLAGEDDEPRDLYAGLARSHPDEFRQWIEADARFRQAVRRMDIYRNLLRRIGVPPEME